MKKEETMNNKNETRFYITKKLQDGQEALNSKVKDIREKYIQKSIDKGKEFNQNISEKIKDRIDHFVEKGTDAVKENRAVRTISEKMNDGVESFLDLMKFPKKGDILKLNTVSDSLNQRIKKLEKKKSA